MIDRPVPRSRPGLTRSKLITAPDSPKKTIVDNVESLNLDKTLIFYMKETKYNYKHKSLIENILYNKYIIYIIKLFKIKAKIDINYLIISLDKS